MISTHHNYDNGYIGLVNLRLQDLPKTVAVHSHILQLKSELHVSLICAKRIAAIINPELKDQVQEEIVKLFLEFTMRHPLNQFSLLPELRLVRRDHRRTLVVMVLVPGLNLFFRKLENRYKADLPVQPTHITLYTLQPDAGIGILSPEELKRDSEVVLMPDLAIIKE